MPVPFSLLFALGLMAGLTPFAIDMYLPGIPAIAADLGASVELTQLSVTVYLGVFALSQLLLGPLSDVLGRRATILGGTALFIAADLACLLAPNLAWLLVTRALQALGGAAVAVTIPALVRDLFEKDDYARVMGLVMMVTAIGPLLAPTIGGTIVAFTHWRWVFVALAAIALIAGVLFLARVPETLPAARRHTFAIVGILRNYLMLFRHRAGLGYILTGSFSFAGMLVFVTTSPSVYISLHGVEPQWFGALFGINILAAMGVNSLNARLVRRHGADQLLRLGLRIQTAAAALLLVLGAWALASPAQPPLWMAAAAVLVYVAMLGMIPNNAMAGFMAFFPGLAGTASAVAGSLRFGLGALGGTLASLPHTASAAPLLVGMATCGALAAGCYLGLCCKGAGPGRGYSSPLSRGGQHG
jgi:MFS transporter, DHA1 family, multidrug resistance protein